MKTIEIFLASSAELVEDRRTFEIFLNRRNKTLVKEGIFLELVIWEDFLDAMSKTRLQDKYNEALKKCDIFIMLFYTKVGKYTEEEFDTAYDEFQKNDSPLIFTYFKDAPSSVKPQDSLDKFKERLSKLGHFFTVYKNIEGLQLHFMEQLEKLEQEGFLNGSKEIEKQNEAVIPSAKVLDLIRIKIAEGESVSKILQKHRDEVLSLSDSDDIDLELTMLQGRSSKLEKDIRRNLLNSADAGIAQARINNAFLSLLDDIKNGLG